jgi:hypothetical protein
MTRANEKKEAEQTHVRRLFCGLFSGADPGLVIESPDPPAPDVWVRGSRLAEVAGEGVDCIGVEVREYHPARRAEVGERWARLDRVIDNMRRQRPVLKAVAASIDFTDPLLPKDREHPAVARALVEAVEAAAPRILPGMAIRVVFLPQETVGNAPKYAGDITFLPSEGFAVAAKHISLLRLESDPGWEWPLWLCPRMLAGWNAPSTEEFGSILEGKQRKAARYDTQDRPLWLLIVADLGNDQESHIVPREEADLTYLREQVSATGFEFAASHFQRVWLISEFTGGAVQLHPAGPTVV